MKSLNESIKGILKNNVLAAKTLRRKKLKRINKIK